MTYEQQLAASVAKFITENQINLSQTSLSDVLKAFQDAQNKSWDSIAQNAFIELSEQV